MLVYKTLSVLVYGLQRSSKSPVNTYLCWQASQFQMETTYLNACPPSLSIIVLFIRNIIKHG